jgi:hypothetical protein
MIAPRACAGPTRKSRRRFNFCFVVSGALLVVSTTGCAGAGKRADSNSTMKIPPEIAPLVETAVDDGRFEPLRKTIAANPNWRPILLTAIDANQSDYTAKACAILRRAVKSNDWIEVITYAPARVALAEIVVGELSGPNDADSQIARQEAARD